MRKRKLIRLAVFLVPLVFIFSQCFNSKKSEDPRGEAYAGAESCKSCHKEVFNSYLHTAHFMSSQSSAATNIHGSFKNGENEFVFNPMLKVKMHKTDSGFYQTSYENNKPTQSQRFDITFGAVKGQTYAYWVANELFQLPISYDEITHKWINSPGYDNSHAAYERAIGVRCLDCHISYIKPAPPELPGYYTNNEGFDKSSIVYTIDCERCHGPAAEHVKFQTENPHEKKAKYIVSYKSLTREQKINMCAVCHSGGNNTLYKPLFGFKPGDTLEKFMKIKASNTALNFKVIDVHGNQKALLASSKCFMSSNMVCSTCHNTHVQDRGKDIIYAAHCSTCHNKESHNICGLSTKLSPAALTENCISCHMPAFPSRVIITGEARAMVHTHRITIYSEATKKVLSQLKIVE